MTAQLDIFGGEHTELEVTKRVNRILDETPPAREDHGILMEMYANELGFYYDKPAVTLQQLFRVSPQVERATRKWKERDRSLQNDHA